MSLGGLSWREGMRGTRLEAGLRLEARLLLKLWLLQLAWLWHVRLQRASHHVATGHRTATRVESR
jgi:hypothetical protein